MRMGKKSDIGMWKGTMKDWLLQVTGSAGCFWAWETWNRSSPLVFTWPSLRWLLLLTVPFVWRLTWREFLLFCTKVGLTLSVQSSHLALFYILPAHPTDFPDYVTLSIASVLCASFLEHIFCFFPGFQSHSTRFHASPQAGPQTPGRWHWGFWWRMDTKATRWGARRI